MIKDILIKFHNDLNQFDQGQPIAVTWENNELVFRQYNRLVMTGYLSPLFLPKKGFKYGILSQKGLVELTNGLVKLLQDPELESYSMPISPTELGFIGYTYFKDNRLVGPQVKYRIELVSITNKFLTRLILKNYSPETKMMWKLIKSELKRK